MSDSPVTRPAPPPTETLREARGIIDDIRHALEMPAARRAYAAGMGASEFEAFLDSRDMEALAALSCVEALVEQALVHAHENLETPWGYDAAGIHGFDAEYAATCPMCAALAPFSVAAAERTARRG